MLLTKNAKSAMAQSLASAATIDPKYFSMKLKAFNELHKILFDLTHEDYNKIDNELKPILDETMELMKEREVKTA